MQRESSRRISQIPYLTYSRRDFYRQLFTHRGKALSVFLMVMCAALLIAYISPSIYQSESMFYVRLGRENVRLDPTTTFGQAPTMAIPDSRENELNSVAEILKSRVMAEKVVDMLGPEFVLEDTPKDEEEAEESAAIASSAAPAMESLRELLVDFRLSTPLSDRERAILKLRKNLSAQAFPKSNLLSISFRARSPQCAQRIVAAYTDTYLNEHSKLNRTPNAYQFLEQQTERIRDELVQSEEALKDLKLETQLASPDTQRELLVTRLSRLQDDLLESEALAVAIQSEVDALTSKLAALSETQVASVTAGLSNPATDGMRQLLYSLQVQEKKLAGMYTSDHPELRSIREQILESRAILDQEKGARETVTEGPNRAFEELNLTRLRQHAMLESTQAKAEALRQQIADAKQQFQSQIDNELRIATLQRHVELQDANFRKYAENLEQANIDQSLEAEHISNINVFQPASLIEKPVGPNVLLILMAGLVGGVFAGVGTAILCDTLDHSLKTPEEIEEKLGLPMLASIPSLGKAQLALSGKSGE